MATVFLFPGQSSVSPTAIERARRAHPAAESVADAARHALGRDAIAPFLERDDAPVCRNSDVQMVVFLATQMYLAALEAEGITATTSLGLSLGEYSHVVHIGALSLEEALAVVAERGRCYDRAPHGMMLTVLGVDVDVVENVVAQAEAFGPLVISNYNARTQHVISGTQTAVEYAAGLLEEEHGAATIVIERKVPMHSPLMTKSSAELAPALKVARWQTPRFAYRPNVTADAREDATPAEFISLLTRHVSEPVQWQRSLVEAIASTDSPALVEVGPGGVLHNMVKRTYRSLPNYRVDPEPAEDPREHFRRTVEALRARAQ